METTPESIAREIERLHRTGKSEDAFALALECAASFPQSSLALTNAGYFYLLRGEPSLALEAYEAAIRANSTNAEARRGLAVAKTQCGIAAQGDSTTAVPYRGTGRPIEVLVPITLGSGNVVTERLFDERVFAVTKLAVELHPPDAPLPGHDVVFNAIGEADSSGAALAKARELLARSNKRVLNDPARVARTGRYEQTRRFAGLDDVIVPRLERVSRARVRDLPIPVLLRVPGYHAGEHFARIEGAGDLESALSRLPGDDFFAFEYLDVREPAGTFAKYRVMIVDSQLYPLHLAISNNWKVHYFSAAMAEVPTYRAREGAFLRDPRKTVGERAWAALERVASATELDYGGIDFALDAQGRVVLFESNATMAVRYPPEDPMWAYRRPAVDRVIAAISAMLRRYSSI
ncbi:MAG TPA: hypothetical protein VMF11_07655 [Candidatus Baltobacteraceae bacterium]|nr:hypothetical protein [Candidatus Baltobacteraceae bacterium]